MLSGRRYGANSELRDLPTKSQLTQKTRCQSCRKPQSSPLIFFFNIFQNRMDTRLGSVARWRFGTWETNKPVLWQLLESTVLNGHRTVSQAAWGKRGARPGGAGGSAGGAASAPEVWQHPLPEARGSSDASGFEAPGRGGPRFLLLFNFFYQDFLLPQNLPLSE